VKALHSEFLDDLEALQHPLPFFLEYPYRLFRQAQDPLQRIRHGQVILNLIAKIPLYLVGEELCMGESNAGIELIQKLRDKPLSDGALIGLRRDLAITLDELEPSARPQVFAELANAMKPNDSMSQLVSSRNRYHHPPYDEKQFIETLNEVIPTEIAELRKQLEKIRFCLPQSCAFKGGSRIITARNASCSEPTFPVETFLTQAEFESFPSGALVAYQENIPTTVILKQTIVWKQVMNESIDFGVFDHMRGNVAEYQFVRQL